MTNARAIRHLKALKRDILADGVVDWEETERLVDFIRPLAKHREADFGDFLKLLEQYRADGKITQEESMMLALQLEALCAQLEIRTLAFWLVVAVAALVAVALFK